MITLHVSIAEGSLYLWSEGQDVGGIKELRQALRAIGFGIKVLKSSTRELVAWLPSSEGMPIPSSPLMGSIPQKGKTGLSPYNITARPLGIEQALELASIARKGNIPATGVIFGSSIYWVSNLLNTALKLVAEENFLPTIFHHGSRWEARWVPIPGSEEEQKLKKLASLMPPVCRCVNNGEKIPNMPSRLAVNTLLAKSVDGIVRGSSPAGYNKGGHDSLHDAWMYALGSWILYPGRHLVFISAYLSRKRKKTSGG